MCSGDGDQGDLFHSKEEAADAFTDSGGSGLSVGCSSGCPKSGSHAGRSTLHPGPMEWGDTGMVGWRAGTGLDWALNTILNIFSEAQPGHCLFFISNTELAPIRAEYEE